ncbi:MAG: glycosyltransferase family 9 protein [Pseudomonadota bacterium]
MQQALRHHSSIRAGNPGASAASILVFRHSDLRGFILALGALETLRVAHPRARICLVARPDMEPFATLCPYVDDVIVDLEHDDKRRRGARITALRRSNFDFVYDLDGDVRSETLLRALKPRFGPAPPSSGPTPSATFSSAPKPGSVGEIQRLSDQLTLAGLGLTRIPVPDLDWVRHKLGDPPRLSPEYFGISGRFALISVNSESSPSELHWPQTSIVSLCHHLVRAGITPVLTGERDAGALAQSVEMSVREAKNLVARADASQLIALSSLAEVSIGPDSASIQIAGLCGTPCLVLSTTQAARASLDIPYTSAFITVHGKKIADIQAEALWQTLTCWQQAAIASPLEESPVNRHIGP